jgi:hypothetical protein
MGDDEVGISFSWSDRSMGKRAVIRGHEFHDPPPEKPWWDRLRARLGC